MDGYSEDEISSRESQQSSENEGEVHERSPISDEEPVIDEAGPSSSSFTINEHTNNNTTTSISKLQPFADTCKSYEIVPYVAAIHACHVHALDVTKNMRWVFTGGDDGFIRKYDFFASMSGKTLLTQNQKHTQVESVQKAGVIVSYWENEEQPPPTPKSEGTSQNISEPSSSEIKLSSVYSIAVQSEAIWLLSGLESGSINLYTVRHEEGRCHHVLRHHKAPVSVLKITQEETGCVSGSWDKTVLYWDLNTGQVEREFSGHSSQISSISFRPIIPSSSQLSSPQNSPTPYDGPEDTLTNSNDILLTTSIDGNCFVWDRRANNLIPRKMPPPEKTPPWCLSACWSADGSKIYCGRRNGTVDEWDFLSGKFIRSLKMPSNSGPVSYVLSMPNGKHIVCASTDNIRLWNVFPDEYEISKSAVPFLIIPGHHVVDQTCRYMITTSGNRGWEGGTTECALFYDITPS
ncbi:15081_t:CDS:10 [Entrophospora sp. SA101]|nr:14442_t:CDS:10 [Entrophospora sp. SA101]CAJ0628238.1 5177_t:CDS:10 [Entrophospora sp. SA101]CAJ0768881.1 15081_t:CDS:10 [Entrophospora sp. SA101]CAJ0868008.1 6816_t:CDS:10 [Entrophospora sp. SA101]CAJ0915260.1 5232_t:CDS:10 [Entrophospora sp. SA101]